ncbi:hypothetical protein ACTFIW_003875 [Dictyostelium discoideum]
MVTEDSEKDQNYKKYEEFQAMVVYQRELKTTASLPNSTQPENGNTPITTPTQTVDEETDDETEDEYRVQQYVKALIPYHMVSLQFKVLNPLHMLTPKPDRAYPTVLATSGCQETSNQIQNETSNLVDKQHHSNVKTKVHETLHNTFLVKNELIKN